MSPYRKAQEEEGRSWKLLPGRTYKRGPSGRLESLPHAPLVYHPDLSPREGDRDQGTDSAVSTGREQAAGSLWHLLHTMPMSFTTVLPGSLTRGRIGGLLSQVGTIAAGRHECNSANHFEIGQCLPAPHWWCICGRFPGWEVSPNEPSASASL
jgi:hypothetical protein